MFPELAYSRLFLCRRDTVLEICITAGGLIAPGRQRQCKQLWPQRSDKLDVLQQWSFMVLSALVFFFFSWVIYYLAVSRFNFFHFCSQFCFLYLHLFSLHVLLLENGILRPILLINLPFFVSFIFVLVMISLSVYTLFFVRNRNTNSKSTDKNSIQSSFEKIRIFSLFLSYRNHTFMLTTRNVENIFPPQEITYFFIDKKQK